MQDGAEERVELGEVGPLLVVLYVRGLDAHIVQGTHHLTVARDALCQEGDEDTLGTWVYLLPVALEQLRKREAACAKVRLGECTKARQALMSGSLAPGNAETLAHAA